VAVVAFFMLDISSGANGAANGRVSVETRAAD
jgi:hypothetical protein